MENKAETAATKSLITIASTTVIIFDSQLQQSDADIHKRRRRYRVFSQSPNMLINKSVDSEEWTLKYHLKKISNFSNKGFSQKQHQLFKKINSSNHSFNHQHQWLQTFSCWNKIRQLTLIVLYQMSNKRMKQNYQT